MNRQNKGQKTIGTTPLKGKGRASKNKKAVHKESFKKPQNLVKVEKPLEYKGETDKAYNILAKQLKISSTKAKEMIDRGVVYSKGKKVLIARAQMPINTEFKVEKLQKPHIIFENSDFVVVDKPPFMTSDEVADTVGATLVHRLDKETSGVLVLAKNEETLKKAIDAFKKRAVYKEYIAIVSGVVAEGGVVDAPLLITKGTKARALVDKKFGKSAKTIYEPLEIMGKKTKLKIIIETGRTHQIRAHMKFIGHPIVGDTQYGGKKAKRVMLHSHKLSLLGLEFEASEPEDFALRD